MGYRATGVSFETERQDWRREAGLRLDRLGLSVPTRRRGVKTGNPLDFAVQGDGWFGIQTPRGPAYTRDGRARIDKSGTLRTLNGDPILDAGGAPILVDGAAGPLTVSADGMITQNERPVAAIGLFAIKPGASLIRAENPGVVPDEPPTPILEFTRDEDRPGAVESSNVDPVREMTRLIDVTRAFDGVAAEASQSETSLQEAIETSRRPRDRRSLRRRAVAAERLERRVDGKFRGLPAARVSGAIVEVSMSVIALPASRASSSFASASASTSVIASRSAKWSGSTRPRPPSSRSTRAATRRSARAPIAPTICQYRRIGRGKVGSWTRSGGRSTARASSSADEGVRAT